MPWRPSWGWLPATLRIVCGLTIGLSLNHACGVHEGHVRAARQAELDTHDCRLVLRDLRCDGVAVDCYECGDGVRRCQRPDGPGDR